MCQAMFGFSTEDRGVAADAHQACELEIHLGLRAKVIRVLHGGHPVNCKATWVSKALLNCPLAPCIVGVGDAVPVNPGSLGHASLTERSWIRPVPDMAANSARKSNRG